jgi:hypothetical protein
MSDNDNDNGMQAIQLNVDLVRRIAADELDIGVACDEAGVRWLDGFIQRQHEGGDQAIRERLVQTLGAFLGQCVVETFGGRWIEASGTWGVHFDAQNAVFPFAKVAKQLDHGSRDSVLSFFRAIPAVFKLQRQ